MSFFKKFKFGRKAGLPESSETPAPPPYQEKESSCQKSNASDNKLTKKTGSIGPDAFKELIIKRKRKIADEIIAIVTKQIEKVFNDTNTMPTESSLYVFIDKEKYYYGKERVDEHFSALGYEPSHICFNNQVKFELRPK